MCVYLKRTCTNTRSIQTMIAAADFVIVVVVVVYDDNYGDVDDE